MEDSPVALAVLSKILQQSPEIEIVGTARTGVEALSLIPKTQPQVVCTDLHMPHMDGLTLTSEIMMRFPLPILVVSVSVQSHDTQKVFQLLAAGAVDVWPKPVAGLSDQNIADNAALIEKIRILAGVKVFKKKRSHSSNTHSSLPPSARSNSAQPTSEQSTSEQSHTKANNNTASQPKPFSPKRTSQKRIKAIAIGASTGGPQALHTLLSKLPKTVPPIICVQHIGQGFLQGLLRWMQTDCALTLEIAKPGQRPAPGYAYFALEDQHLQLDRQGCFTYSKRALVDGHRPSVTVAFEAIAQHYGEQSIGILLTGMGRDGATGLHTISQVGGVTLAQDEATSVVFGMPKVAIELGAVDHVLPLEAIAPTLIQYLQPIPSTHLSN